MLLTETGDIHLTNWVVLRQSADNLKIFMAELVSASRFVSLFFPSCGISVLFSFDVIVRLWNLTVHFLHSCHIYFFFSLLSNNLSN